MYVLQDNNLFVCVHVKVFVYLSLCYLFASGSKAIEILEAYEGTLEDDYPPENERCEHGEMLLYKVKPYYLSFGTPFLLHLASYGIGILLEGQTIESFSP